MRGKVDCYRHSLVFTLQTQVHFSDMSNAVLVVACLVGCPCKHCAHFFADLAENNVIVAFCESVCTGS